MWIKALDRLPEVGRIVRCRIQHLGRKDNIQEHELMKVNESDCDWRTSDDNSEVGYDWAVIEWLDS
ncbi:MAG: hypothetical protein Q7K26_06695 [bacterium]|nr:hypothetical protein [bacterium]MDO8729534.1 hypothetical protein [bacterium]